MELDFVYHGKLNSEVSTNDPLNAHSIPETDVKVDAVSQLYPEYILKERF